MSKVISFPVRTATKKVKMAVNTSGMDSFTAELEKDIDNMCVALSVDRDKAVQIAADFYRKYPMLIEHVRSTDFMLRGK